MIQQALGSSANQRINHAAQHRYVNRRVNAQPMTARKFNLDHPGRRPFTCGWGDRVRQTERNKGRLRGMSRSTFFIENLASPAKQQARSKPMATRHCRNRRRRIFCLREDRLLLLARPRPPSAGDDDVRGVRHGSRHSADIDSIGVMYPAGRLACTRRPSPSGYPKPNSHLSAIVIDRRVVAPIAQQHHLTKWHREEL